MPIDRRRFLQAGAAAVSVAALSRGAAARAASQPGYTWLLPRTSFNDLYAVNADVCQSAFNQGNTWFSTLYEGSATTPANPVPDGFTGIAVVKFQAWNYTDSFGVKWGLSQVISELPTWVDAVQYDSETWGNDTPPPFYTPPIEQGAWLYNSYANHSYAKDFCDLAHQYNLKVVLTPGNDLCNNNANDAYPNDAPQYPLDPGETDYEAYYRYDFASASQWLNPGDIYEYQAQKLETLTDPVTGNKSPYLYKTITTEIASQIQTSGVIFLAGIGTTNPNWDQATGQQLANAAKSVTSVTAGYWPNVDNASAQTGPMITMLQDLGY